MKTPSPVLAIAATFLTSELWTSPSSSSSLAFANAQQTTLTITECTEEDKSACATASNRTCYNYEDTDSHECGKCLNGFLEYEESCYDIEEIDTDKFVLLSELLEIYLPEYVDSEVSTEDRVQRLIQAAKVISFWNSHVPPPAFNLGLNKETFLTVAERAGRLGILPELQFDVNSVGKRGKMARFVSSDDGDNEDDFLDATIGDGKVRRLSIATTGKGQRSLEDIPSAVDWEAEGYTTIVKNQGICGCCWAVATAAAVESALMITNQTNRYDSSDKNSLSFQQMISCDELDKGCQGGNILQATKYVWEHNDLNNGNHGGLFAYADWPYTDFFGKTTTQCQAQEMVNAGAKPAAYLNFPQVVNDVNDRWSSFEERRERLMAAVAQQPVISVVRSGCHLLSNYRDGVLTHDEGCQCCETSCIDHAIVIVGYDANAPTPYWKLRNSWGIDWGEDGYFRIAMNDPACGWGLFGMLAESAFPSEAVKNLEDLPERPGWWERSSTWEKVVVILFSILGFCCLCGCLGALLNKRRRA